MQIRSNSQCLDFAVETSRTVWTSSQTSSFLTSRRQMEPVHSAITMPLWTTSHMSPTFCCLVSDQAADMRMWRHDYAFQPIESFSLPPGGHEIRLPISNHTHQWFADDGRHDWYHDEIDDRGWNHSVCSTGFAKMCIHEPWIYVEIRYLF